MAVQAALNLCVCVRETEAVIVKHQLVVQLLLKEVRETEEGEKRNQECAKQKRRVPTPVQKTTENIAVQQQKRAAEKIKCAGFKGFKG